MSKTCRCGSWRTRRATGARPAPPVATPRHVRAHEFDKVEILAVATPEQAPDLLVEMTGRAEALIAGLELPYRIIEICTGDMGQSHHRSFDIEVYAPGCDAWLEVSSISWFSDYQARRADIRYRVAGQKGTQIAHTLNGSALAVPRVWAAIVENYREPDGSVVVPEVLHPYMRGVERITQAMSDLASRRADYESAGLDVGDVDASPLVQWQQWYYQASEAGCVEPHAFVLSTVDDEGWPQSRYLLAHGADERGFSFFTNYESAKSAQLMAEPRAAMLFTWLQLHRQVRVVGVVERLPEAESDAYFASRPRSSQIGAWSSPQSQVLPDRARSSSVSPSSSRPSPTSTRSASGVLGRVAASPGVVRVLAGAAQPFARPGSLSPRRNRRRSGSSSGWLRSPHRRGVDETVDQRRHRRDHHASDPNPPRSGSSHGSAGAARSAPPAAPAGSPGCRGAGRAGPCGIRSSSVTISYSGRRGRRCVGDVIGKIAVAPAEQQRGEVVAATEAVDRDHDVDVIDELLQLRRRARD